MEPRTLSFIVVFVGFVILAHGSPLPDTEERDVTSTVDPQKVLLDCKHSDYRTYIKCLKRQKRHHSHGDGYTEPDAHCMETCMKQCNVEHNCERNCSHCMRRTKHRHQIITEYETDCSSGNCVSGGTSGSDLPNAANITTKIDINNVINSCVPCTPGCTCPMGGGGSGGPNITNTDCCPNCHPPRPCYYPPPGVFPSSQFTLVPQLTLGLGLGPINDCQYPFQWPCLQRPYPPPNTNPVDCSGCGHPLLHYRCDTSCYLVQNSHVTGNHIPNTNSGSNCQSPHCVGGSRGL